MNEPVTKDLPNGDAELALQALQRRFKPDTRADKVKLKGNLIQVSYSSSRDLLARHLR